MIRIHLSVLLGEKKWTQAQLSQITGIRPTTISEYYNEIIVRANLEHLDLICEALDCSLDDLITYEPNKIPRIRRNQRGNPIGPVKEKK